MFEAGGPTVRPSSVSILYLLIIKMVSASSARTTRAWLNEADDNGWLMIMDNADDTGLFVYDIVIKETSSSARHRRLPSQATGCKEMYARDDQEPSGAP